MSTEFLPANIDKSWTLFLDRDGVINDEIQGSYVTEWDEFQFCTGVLPALKILGDLFGAIVLVTNQRGVGRGIMSIQSLRDIHGQMLEEIRSTGGRIDRIYACTAVDDADHNRKPNPGMGLQAREDYPGIDFRKSVIVGNSVSDMEFGKRLAMHTVFITTKHEPAELAEELIDVHFDSLIAWAKSLVATPVF